MDLEYSLRISTAFFFFLLLHIIISLFILLLPMRCLYTVYTFLGVDLILTWLSFPTLSLSLSLLTATVSLLCSSGRLR